MIFMRGNNVTNVTSVAKSSEFFQLGLLSKHEKCKNAAPTTIDFFANLVLSNFIQFFEDAVSVNLH